MNSDGAAAVETFDEGVWKVIVELGQNERHFNQLQHQYRMMASTWLLAMFGATGFAFSQEHLSVPRELVVAIIGLAAAVGVTQLWNLDLRVYHQLLDSCFVEGLRLERACPWLPQMRSRMIGTQTPDSGQRSVPLPPASPDARPSRPAGVLARVVWFYMVGVSVALLTMFIGFGLSLGPAASDTRLLGLAATAVTVIGLWDFEMYRQTTSPALDAWIAEQREARNA